MTLLLATLSSIDAAIVVGLLAAAAIWTGCIVAWHPTIRLGRRRPVPWQAQDVLVISLLFFLVPAMMHKAVKEWKPIDNGPDNGPQKTDDKHELAHAAQQLLRTKDPVAVAIAAVMAIVIAPLIEEFIFRVLLQGWLEAVWSRRRRQQQELRRAPLAWMPIILPAAIFALMHVRFGKPPSTEQDLQFLVVAFLAQMAADLVVLAAAIGILRFAVGATAADLGWKAEKVLPDARLGILCLLMVTPPILAIQAALTTLVQATGADVAPDPIPLFFLALVFGMLYHRTHRIAPSLVLHMAFNATSVALMFVG
jgi:membrane protease YdiL (CAAX protease family)